MTTNPRFPRRSVWRQCLAAAVALSLPLAADLLAGDGPLLAQAVDAHFVVTVVLIILATFISEDMTCIGAGLLVARGDLRLATALAGCFLGLWLGDMLLYLAGRGLGRPLLRRAPVRWLIREEDVDRYSAWLNERGAAAVFIGRFLPGSRLPMYFASGVLRTSFPRFSLYFLVAVAVWTPLLVGAAALIGRPLIRYFEAVRENALTSLAVALLAVWLLMKLVLPLFSHRGRRLLTGAFSRKLRWEFWPVWFFNIPVVLNWLRLSLRHRSLTLFTAANPGFPAAGGFVGESKYAILSALNGAGDSVARTERVNPVADLDVAVDAVRVFMERHSLGFPLVLKPDVGERGVGVRIVRDATEVRDALSRADGLVLAQEYVPGVEFGVLYYRYPGEDQGIVFSVTEKRLPAVVGDGRRNLERLILDDDRAVCLVREYFKANAGRLSWTPEPGERAQLVEVGNHCRGAICLDGRRVQTPRMELAFDLLAKRCAGFHFGRFDVRAPSVDALMQGRDFKIIELNGVTSEATHVYDPQYTPIQAWRTLFEQWRILYDLGAQNRADGCRPATVRELLGLLWRRYVARPVNSRRRPL